MGQSLTKEVLHSKNDYELVIKSAKDLEHILEAQYHAEGKGLHEKITSVEGELTPALVKRMRYLATIRNKLVHEHGFDAIPDRDAFIVAFEESQKELAAALASKSGSVLDSSCNIM